METVEDENVASEKDAHSFIQQAESQTPTEYKYTQTDS